jgi:hypothetical protein
VRGWRATAAIALTLFAAFSVANITPAAAGAQVGCGPARTTLTDPSAADIDTSQIIGVHVAALASFPLPDGLPDNSRFDPYETTVYRTSGALLKERLQPNGEIDVVIADPEVDLSIIAVFPDVAHCGQAADSNALQLMQAARQSVIATLGTPNAGEDTPLRGQALITGIGFIDPDAAAQGQSGIKLAPVLDIQFDQAASAGQPAGPATMAAVAPAATGAAVAATAGASPVTGTPAVATAVVNPIYYVDTASPGAVIYCSTAPAEQPINARTTEAFRSLDLALAAYPGYHLIRPC